MTRPTPTTAALAMFTCLTLAAGGGAGQRCDELASAISIGEPLRSVGERR